MAVLAALAAGAAAAVPGPFPLAAFTRITIMDARPYVVGDSFELKANATNVTAGYLQRVRTCAREVGGLGGRRHELVITLALDEPVWRKAAENMAAFGPVAVKFLEDNDLDGMNFDWEDKVDTKMYMQLLSGLRRAFDAAGKHYLITVAPGWPRYPWDASANGVVDAFDMMSYADPLTDCTSRVALFEKTYQIPRRTLLCGVESEPHCHGDPGWNTDASIEAKTSYAFKNGLQGMFSFTLDNDRGPWPKAPAEPTYQGGLNMSRDAVVAAGGSEKLNGFVVNTYLRLNGIGYPDTQLQCPH
eukprot:TRINITY_DN1160_c0_g1_i1.p1 TRINITY_DN1160_c0_g1~~TRINITY_DN1160_c0_g1_i1.p1  ORF type:complete len:322 (+),score=102.78 TRINITY_DN1160_c0_g1_i1:65-967(+)